MDYNIDDFVLVEDLDWYNNNKENNGTVILSDLNFTPNMKQFLGRIYQIGAFSKGYPAYYFKGVERYMFTDAMIRGRVIDSLKNPHTENDIFRLDGKLYILGESGCDKCPLVSQCKIKTDKCMYMGYEEFTPKAYGEDEHITVTVPKGYKPFVQYIDGFPILKCIKKLNNMDDLMGEFVEGWYFTPDGIKHSTIQSFDSNKDLPVFSSKLLAMRYASAAEISQLMPYYGGILDTLDKHNDTIVKYEVRYNSNINDLIVVPTGYSDSELLFKTPSDAKDFINNNGKLVLDYLCLYK